MSTDAALLHNAIDSEDRVFSVAPGSDIVRQYAALPLHPTLAIRSTPEGVDVLYALGPKTGVESIDCDYRLEASTDLRTWQELDCFGWGTLYERDMGGFPFSDEASLPQRFYRVRWVK